MAPSTPADVAGMLREALDDPDPVLFLEHKKTFTAHIFVGSKAPWFSITDDLPQYEGHVTR